jgi:hypothetical protein
MFAFPRNRQLLKKAKTPEAMAQSWVQLRFTVHLQMYEKKCTIELRMRGSSKKGFPSFHLFNLLSATGSHTIQNAFAVGARAVLPDLNRRV